MNIAARKYFLVAGIAENETNVSSKEEVKVYTRIRRFFDLIKLMFF